VDYAVVILCGPDLASFVSRGEVLALFNPATRAQLHLARRLADISLAEAASAGAATAFSSLVRGCIKRDQSWKDFYDTEVRQIANVRKPIAEVLIQLAAAERDASRIAVHDPGGAADIIERAARKHASDDAPRLGWYLQIAAAYRFGANEGAALELQAAAYLKNDRMFAPPKGVQMRPTDPGRVEAPAAILRWYGRFENPNGALAAVQALRVQLSFAASPEMFEQAICGLAELVGAHGLRPERTFGKGPDDLWLWGADGYVIECKNEEQGASLPKRDSGQLHDSLQWFKDNYPTRDGLPVLVARAVAGHSKANFPSGTRVITPAKLASFMTAVENFVAAVAKQPANQWTPKQVGQLATQHGVAREQFVKRHTVELE
jgi:hypothetical protein